MKTIVRRLQQLEQRLPPPAAPEQTGPSPGERIAEFLTQKGIVRGEKESWAETFARAMGISPQELRTRLLRRAAGGPWE